MELWPKILDMASFLLVSEAVEFVDGAGAVVDADVDVAAVDGTARMPLPRDPPRIFFKRNKFFYYE